MQVSDLIGICEDLKRQQTLVMGGFAEIVRNIALLRAYRDQFLAPLVATKDLAGMAQDRDIPTDAAAGAAEVAMLADAVNDAADFTEVDDLKAALDTFFAMDIFHPDTYVIRPAKALDNVDKVIQEFEAAKAAKAAEALADAGPPVEVGKGNPGMIGT